MYFPYMRGKQYELLALKELVEENAENLKKVHPILEPVRQNMRPLVNALATLQSCDITANLILNPKVGQLAGHRIELNDLSEEKDLDLIPSFIVDDQNPSKDLQFIAQFVQEKHPDTITIIHRSFGSLDKILQSAGITPYVNHVLDEAPDVYLEALKKQITRKHNVVSLKDGFNRVSRNSDFLASSFFSENHLTYAGKGCIGFGDYLTIGKDYSESGGPAYAVALHLTYLDRSKMNQMFCAHFVSDSNSTPVDPAGKFMEALDKMHYAKQVKQFPFIQSLGIRRFAQLFDDGHFPGLGVAKKLSMLHHMETVLSCL